ncbi:hypothetical protein [Gordonia sihwensis]|uniref:Minor tail protein n=1 Tax=Gordonia sihwensis NBRC 108236 TaxID=1223544 RepID=L7LGW8_9ACTN|nr:hypothetical protein [Gordonia sihwensis]GAC59347.1 hypothetical protein GSI01S_01_03140 [Gordonia sihwensis NBRC 108236]
MRRSRGLVDDTLVRLYDWRGTGQFVELSGPRQGDHGAQLLEGVGGLWEAQRSLVKIETARLPGSIPVTVRIEELLIDLPTIVQGSDSLEWQWWNRRIHRMLSFTHDSPLVVQTLPWGPRWISVRRRAAHEEEIVEDPTFGLSQIWTWQLVAHDPDWRSPDLTAEWDNSSGTGRGNLRIAYRGDRPSFPKWTGVGPDWNLQEPVSGLWNPLPRMAAGEEWKVDAHPLASQLMSSLDRNKWRQLQRGFTASVDEEGEYVLGVECSGPASAKVQLRLEQRYEHPWG